MSPKKKKYIWHIVVLLLVALTLWVHSRWDAWFHNPPEEPYVASSVPTRVLLTFGNDGENSRMVSWMCDSVVDPSACLLLADTVDTLRIQAIGEVFESRAGKAAYYRATLDSLQADHAYSYAVETQGERSDWYHFSTSDPERKEFSFLFVGDVQDTIDGIANQLFKEAILHHPEVEFVAFGGDLIERPMHSYYEETFRSIDSFCTAMPMVNIAGNHDYLKYLIRKCERRFALTFPYFLQGMEKRGDANHLFSFTYHDTEFFLLDTDRGLYFLNQQRSWLRNAMEQSTAAHKIVIAHHPLYSVKKPKNNLEVRWMFNDIICENHTELVLQGHEHGYTHCTNDEAPLTTNLCTMLPLYTVSHCSPKNYNLSPSERFHPVHSGSRYYQIVSVDSLGMTMRAYDAHTQALIDSVRIIK